MPTASLIAALVLAAAVSGFSPPETQGKESEVTAPPPVRQDRTFGPATEIDGKLVASGEFVITYVDEKAFEADDGAAKERSEGGREVTELLRQYARVVDYESLKGEDKADEMEAKKANLEERDDVERVDYSGLLTIPGNPYTENTNPTSDEATTGEKLPESGGVGGASLLIPGAGVLLLSVVVLLLVRGIAR